MKRRLRISGFKDYVAVDEVNEKGHILSTPIYLTKDKPETLLALDIEENKYYSTEVVFDGEKLRCKDVEGFHWQSELEEFESDRLFVHVTFFKNQLIK